MIEEPLEKINTLLDGTSVQVAERSGDYGAAIRGDEKTEAWAKQTDLGGTPEGRPTSGLKINQIAVTVGGVLLVALILLCFRLGYEGLKKSADSKGFTGKAYLNDSETLTPYTGARVPAGIARVPSTTVRPLTPPVIVAAPANSNMPPPPANLLQQNLFASAEERENALSLLADCRSAYELSGELTQKWFAAISAEKTIERINPTNTQTTDATQNAVLTAPRPLSTKEWNAIDTQMEAISATVGLATQPARYPVALQDISIGVGREMRTYLQTARAALAQTDAQKRSAIQARAETHREKAGQLLTNLESAVKTGTLPAPNATTTNGDDSNPR